MTTAPTPYGEQPAPNRRPWVKRAVIVLLLLALAWMALVVFRYCTTGKPVAEIAPLPKPLANALSQPPKYVGSYDGVARPLGVAVASNGTVYAPETSGERLIRVFDKDGQPGQAFAVEGTTKLSRYPIYVAVSPKDQRVYVSDQQALTIFIFTPNGEVVGHVPSPFEGGWAPLALAFDKAGNLYVTDVTPGNHRLVVLDPDGNLVRTFGTEGEGAGQFSFPNGIAVDGKGYVYVSDSGNGRVLAFDADGNLLYGIGRGVGKGDLALPRGIAVDDERRVLLVVDTTNQGVNVYDISGSTPKFIYTLGGQGTAADSFRFPNGVAVDGGKVYITDRENNRVTIWRF